MQTLTLEITQTKATQVLRKMAARNEIRIIAESTVNTSELPMKSLTLQEFRQWINLSEAAPTISLKAARSEWTSRKKRLQK